MLYIVDLRAEWAKKPFITFWRENDCGYCYPLSWAGLYSHEKVEEGGRYYTALSGRTLIRFAVPRDVIEHLGANPPPRFIDNDAGPVLYNTPLIRAHLRRSAFMPARLAVAG